MATIFIVDPIGDTKQPVANVSELQDLARSGVVTPDTIIEVNGKNVYANKIKDLQGIFIVLDNTKDSRNQSTTTVSSDSKKSKTTSTHYEFFRQKYQLLDVDEVELELYAKSRYSLTIGYFTSIVKSIMTTGWIFGVLLSAAVCVVILTVSEGKLALLAIPLGIILLIIPVVIAREITRKYRVFLNLLINHSKDVLRKEIYLARLLENVEQLNKNTKAQ